jgi:acid phosphatase family membrane protein YuiD
MSFINGILQNDILLASLWAWLVAQIIKIILYMIVNKSFNPERLLGDGGMPSSHSATVMAMVTSTAFHYGSNTFELAVTAILALIVMHDAMGVRLETGKQAKVINDMLDWFEESGNDLSPGDKLKEFVGHTPTQVFFGALLGVVVGIVTCIM